MELAWSSQFNNNINSIRLSRKLGSFSSIPQSSFRHHNDADLRVNNEKSKNSLGMTKNFAPMDSNIRHSFDQPTFKSNDAVNELESNSPKNRFMQSQDMNHNTNLPEPASSRRPSTSYSNLSQQKPRSSFRSGRRFKQDRNVNNAQLNPAPNQAPEQGRHIGEDINLNIPERKPSINYRTLLDESRHSDIQGQSFSKGMPIL